MDDSAVYYRSNYGPLDGPLRAVDVAHCLGVLDQAGNGSPIGIAFNGHPTPDPKGAIATFRLSIGKTDLPGRFKIDCRRYVLVDDDGFAHEKIIDKC